MPLVSARVERHATPGNKVWSTMRDASRSTSTGVLVRACRPVGLVVRSQALGRVYVPPNAVVLWGRKAERVRFHPF